LPRQLCSIINDYQISDRSAHLCPASGKVPGIALSRCPMLIDKSHKSWAIMSLAIGAVATCVYVWAGTRDPYGARGGSTTGLWFGILAAVLMTFAMLLSALRRVPSWWWIGARKSWLRGHIWLGALSGWLSLYHSGFHWGGPLEQGLWSVLALTLISGVVGLVLQQLLPRLITARIPYESPVEQIPHLCSELRRRADALIGEIERQTDAGLKVDPATESKEVSVRWSASGSRREKRRLFPRWGRAPVREFTPCLGATSSTFAGTPSSTSSAVAA
jgi:hypothetical protein